MRGVPLLIGRLPRAVCNFAALEVIFIRAFSIRNDVSLVPFLALPTSLTFRVKRTGVLSAVFPN